MHPMSICMAFIQVMKTKKQKKQLKPGWEKQVSSVENVVQIPKGKRATQ